MTALEGNLEGRAKAADLTALDAKVTVVATDVAGRATTTALATLEGKVDAKAEATEVTQLQGKVTVLEGKVEKLEKKMNTQDYRIYNAEKLLDGTRVAL